MESFVPDSSGWLLTQLVSCVMRWSGQWCGQASCPSLGARAVTSASCPLCQGRHEISGSNWLVLSLSRADQLSLTDNFTPHVPLAPASRPLHRTRNAHQSSFLKLYCHCIRNHKNLKKIKSDIFYYSRIHSIIVHQT